MTYTAPHNVLQILGTISSGGTTETWTNTLRFGEGDYLMGDDLTGNPDLPEQVLDDIEGDLRSWFGAIAAFNVANAVKLTGFKFNSVDVNGLYRLGTTYERALVSPPSGGGSGMLPPQCAVAVTFRTNVERGLASRGRMYLPPLGTGACVAGGRLSGGDRDGLASATAALLTNLGNWPLIDTIGDPGRVCVMSKVGIGATRRVNRVDVGDVFDTIRSRREQLLEVRSAEVLVES